MLVTHEYIREQERGMRGESKAGKQVGGKKEEKRDVKLRKK